MVRRVLRETVAGLPSTYWWVWTATLVNRLGSFVVPFLAIYLTAREGYSAAFAGLVLTLYGLGGAIASIAGGILTDLVGRKPTLLGGLLASSVTMIVFGMAHRPWLIAVMAVVLGFTGNAPRPAIGALIADIVRPEDRVRAYALNYWAVNLGFSFAPVVAGLLAAHSYFVLFVGDAVTTLITAALVMAFVREPARPARTGIGAVRKRDPGFGYVLRDRIFMIFVALSFLVSILYMQASTTLPLSINEAGLSPAQYGVIVAANGILIVLAQVPLSRLAERRDPTNILAAAAAITGVGFGLTALASTVPAFLVTVVVWTVGEILTAPTASAVVAGHAPAQMRGRYQGMYTFSWQAASFAAPFGGGLVYEYIGDDAVWAACAIVGLIAALGHLLLRPARRLAAGHAASPVGGGEIPEGLEVRS